MGNVSPDDVRMAIAVESLYLANLLLLPVLAYAILLWLHIGRRTAGQPVARCHLAQALRGGLLGVILPLAVVAYIVAHGGFSQLESWIAAEVYIIFIHTPLILFGLVGLLKAMAGQTFVFPLIGRRC